MEYLASVYKEVGGIGTGMGWVVAKACTKKDDDTIVEFRVAMMCTCTHKGPNSTTRLK